jgi:hypothetical protein
LKLKTGRIFGDYLMPNEQEIFEIDATLGF